MPELPEEVDVLVVGYGPVGAAIAALLGRYGVRTLIVDRLPDVFMAPRAIALDNEALRILQRVGLADDAFARIPIPSVSMRSPQLGEFARVDTAGTIDTHPKLVTFYQPELEAALRRCVETHPSVTPCTGVELVRFEEQGDHVQAVLRPCGGEATTVRATYLVGADGAGSAVRDAIGQNFTGKTYGEDWLVVDATGVPGDFDHVEFLCDPARPTPHMVAPGGRTRWEFMLRPGETREEMEKDETIAKLLQPWAAPGQLRIERKAVYRFHARTCARFHRGRVFLAGDAAHVTPPFAGQGLVAGLRDAVNLAWKLAWVVQGRARAHILGSYDEERRPHAKKMIALARRIGWLVMARSRTRAFVVHGALKLLRLLPSVRALFDGAGFKPANSYPRGLFVPGAHGLARGAWFPQRRLRRNGEVVRSDEVLGPGLALVGLGADPKNFVTAASASGWEAAGGSMVSFDRESFGDPVRHGGHASGDGWCGVVRPDLTVLHDGPLRNADAIVRESLQLLKPRERP